MSYNTEPDRAARRHAAAIIAIIVALAVAGLALIWWMGADPVAKDDVSRTVASETPAGGGVPVPTAPPPAGTPAAGSPPEN
ncbi:hypothetical protein [Paracoccus aestuariivivens]|uniref:Uncharacterized protein n=1 Tax=Paracoccus aestuariivivens TaxID=1820333 RepID=A0A6L6JH35_9RHOB|nr:hypothetical protein [Paracoccus aestuariivivens]MTH79191.1 hypothetical protein [Paracoccus aestuariivivens]